MVTKLDKKVTGRINSEVPECPVCMEPLTPPIYQCKTGHSLCNSCTTALKQPVCPLCRQDMTRTRSLLLEELILKVQVNCPNNGCKYIMSTMDMEEHLTECIFREMECPLNDIFKHRCFFGFEKCSWRGHLKGVMAHFKERHPFCHFSQDSDVELKTNVTRDHLRFYLTTVGKFVFSLTVKIDTIKKMAYWAVQHIGSKNTARQYEYEVHLTSEIAGKRKIVFTDQCFNDAIKADELFRLGKNPMLPLDAFAHFINDEILSYRVLVKRVPPPPNPKNGNSESQSANEVKPINYNTPKTTFKPGFHKKNKNAN